MSVRMSSGEVESIWMASLFRIYDIPFRMACTFEGRNIIEEFFLTIDEEDEEKAKAIVEEFEHKRPFEK